MPSICAKCHRFVPSARDSCRSAEAQIYTVNASGWRIDLGHQGREGEVEEEEEDEEEREEEEEEEDEDEELYGEMR